jgi:hypothetical protein
MTRCSNKTERLYISRSDGLLKSQVSREMDWQGRAYHFATSFAWPYFPNFFFWGYIKDAVYVPSLATTLPGLAGRIRDAVASFPRLT